MAESQIFSVDYNTIRNKVADILGTTGTGTKGYGQRLISESVSQGEIITKTQWDNLSYDIVSIRLHQTGTAPSIVSIAPGSIVYGGEADNPNINYDTLIELATEQRLVNAVGRTIISTKLNPTRTGSWTQYSQCLFSVTFSGYTRTVDSQIISAIDHARFFFNSGGKIRISSSRTGGAITSQNNSWSNLLSSAGALSFEALIPGTVSFYTLTDQWQTFKQLQASSSYAESEFQIDVKCNIADNSLGGATVIDFRVRWNDDYVDPDLSNPNYPGPGTVFSPGDLVDGTLSLTVEEAKAAGDLAPTGVFEIASPTYSPGTITAV